MKYYIFAVLMKYYIFRPSVAKEREMTAKETSRAFDSFDFHKYLGKGGYGVVFRVQEKGKTEPLALKFTAMESAEDLDKSREAKIGTGMTERGEEISGPLAQGQYDLYPVNVSVIAGLRVYLGSTVDLQR